MGNWKEAEIRRTQILEGKGKCITIGDYIISPILGKGYIHDRFSCNCGFTNRSGWQAIIHRLKNLSHKTRKNW